MRAFVRVIRGVAEASLAAVGFALAILLVGAPFALLVRGVHESLSWLVRLRGDVSPLGEAIVAASSVAAAIVLVVAFARGVSKFLNWRREFRARMIGELDRSAAPELEEIAASAIAKPRQYKINLLAAPLMASSVDHEYRRPRRDTEHLETAARRWTA